LTLTWKFSENSLVHLSIKEEEQPEKSQLGKRLLIGREVFEDLSDIVNNYIDICTRYVMETIQHAKYVNDGCQQLIVKLKGDKAKWPMNIAYGFTIDSN